MSKPTYPVTLEVDFENNDLFHVDADFIARARADYYATEVDGHAKGSPGWAQEYEFSLENEDELIDWASGNMNWSDFKGHCKKIERERETPIYDELWGGATLTVVRK